MTTQPQSRFFTLRFLNAALCVFVMSGFVFTASAQPVRVEETPTTPAPTVWQQAIGYQLAQTLSSPIGEQRNRAFQLVTYFAHHRADVDLKPTVPVLLSIYKSDPDEAYRLAAISALHAIGDETAMQQVRRHALDQPSKIVQYLSISALTDYYGVRTFEDNVAAAALAEDLRDDILEAWKKRAEAVVANRQE